jgi:hypothetical protein
VAAISLSVNLLVEESLFEAANVARLSASRSSASPLTIGGYVVRLAKGNTISRAGQEGLKKRRRSTAPAAPGWAKVPEGYYHLAPEASGDGFPVKH